MSGNLFVILICRVHEMDGDIKSHYSKEKNQKNFFTLKRQAAAVRIAFCHVILNLANLSTGVRSAFGGTRSLSVSSQVYEVPKIFPLYEDYSKQNASGLDIHLPFL